MLDFTAWKRMGDAPGTRFAAHPNVDRRLRCIVPIFTVASAVLKTVDPLNAADAKRFGAVSYDMIQAHRTARQFQKPYPVSLGEKIAALIDTAAEADAVS
jgi:hypothetical protein